LPKIALGQYRHYRTRQLYEVIGVSYHSESLAPLVVYRALYGLQELWARPYEMFTGVVDDNGKLVKRFEKV